MGVVVLLLVAAILLLLIVVKLALLVSNKTEPLLTVYEPIGTIIKDWQVARFEPVNDELKKLVQALANNHLSTGSLLETVLINIKDKISLKTKPLTVNLVSQEAIGPLAEQFVFDTKTGCQSVVVGPIDQIKPWIEPDNLDKFQTLSAQAAEHGFLALAVATSFIHSRGAKKLTHQLIGLIIIEPVISRESITVDSSARFLTVAPAEFVKIVYQRLYPAKPIFGLNAGDLATLSPKFAEQDLTKAVVVGSTILNDRHRVLESWRKVYDCRYISTNPDDNDLP